MDWLDVTAIHLKSIEDAAAPEGWQCEWDRYESFYIFSFILVFVNLKLLPHLSIEIKYSEIQLCLFKDA